MIVSLRHGPVIKAITITGKQTNYFTVPRGKKLPPTEPAFILMTHKVGVLAADGTGLVQSV